MAIRNLTNRPCPRRRRRRAALTAASGLVLAVLLPPTTAGAGGGDWLSSVRDRYEPGEDVTLVGYTEPVSHDWADGSGDPERQAWSIHGPYYAYLRVDPRAAARDAPSDDQPWPDVHPTDLRVAEVVAEERPRANDWRTLRAQADFRLPADLPPGEYDVIVCNDPCTTRLGWFYDSPVYVGVDPPHQIVLDWPLDDPAIQMLDDDVLLFDPALRRAGDQTLDDWTVTAAEVRAGYRPTATLPTAPAPTTASPTPSLAAASDEATPAVRTVADTEGGISGEVVAWLAGLGLLLVGWCLAWRLRPGSARIVVRQGGDPRRSGPGTAVDEPEPVRIEL